MNAYGESAFSAAEMLLALRALDLGGQRILRTSALTPVPMIC